MEQEIVQDCINILNDAIGNLQPVERVFQHDEYEAHCRREGAMWRFV